MAKTEERAVEEQTAQGQMSAQRKRKDVDAAIEDVIKRHRGAFERLAKL